MKTRTAAGDWTHPVSFAALVPEGADFKLSAPAAHLPAIAKRLGLIKLANMKAELHLFKDKHGHAHHLTGTMQAKVTQRCCVSLEEFSEVKKIVIDEMFIDQSSHTDQENLDYIIGGDSDFELVADGTLDLAETLVQLLSTDLDPYPRRPGAQLPSNESGKKPTGDGGAFSDLAKLLQGRAEKAPK